jgi:hypothetical protein
VYPSTNVASLVPDYDSQAECRSQPAPLATHSVKSEHEEEDVERAVKAVRAAYNALQTLRASRDSKIPSSLSNASAALNRVLGNLELLTDSTEALSIFRVYIVKEAHNSVGTSISDAIVDDMEETATYFRTMTPVGPSKAPGGLDKQRCQNIKMMADQYKTIVSMVLGKHKECV